MRYLRIGSQHGVTTLLGHTGRGNPMAAGVSSQEPKFSEVLVERSEVNNVIIF